MDYAKENYSHLQNQQKESMFQSVNIVKEKLKQLGEMHFTEFLLPGDLPQVNIGCFNCLSAGEIALTVNASNRSSLLQSGYNLQGNICLSAYITDYFL